MRNFCRGLLATLPLTPGIVAFGLLYGVMARQVGIALATYFTRYTMIAALGQEIPPLLRRWLRYVPPAVLAALVVPAALAPRGQLEISTHAWAVLAGAAVAWRTRSALWTILGGMAAFWLFRVLAPYFG